MMGDFQTPGFGAAQATKSRFAGRKIGPGKPLYLRIAKVGKDGGLGASWPKEVVGTTLYGNIDLLGCLHRRTTLEWISGYVFGPGDYWAD
jgi:hypothetical protein